MASFGTSGGREEPSLEVRPDLERVGLSLNQRPLLGWAVLGHLSAFVMVPLLGFVGLVPLAFLWLTTVVIFFIGGLGFRRRAQFLLTPMELRVDAWAGRLAKPIHMRFPLHGLRLSHTSGGSINKVRVHQLHIHRAGKPKIFLGAMACTGNELDRFVALVHGQRDRSHVLRGAGGAEVPAELRAIQGSAQADDHGR